MPLRRGIQVFAMASVNDDREDGYRRLLRDIHQFPVLDRERERELALRWRLRGDRAAADALVCSSLRYVVKQIGRASCRERV